MADSTSSSPARAFESVPPRRGPAFSVILALTGFLWVMVFAWLGAQDDPRRTPFRFTGQQGDYYNLLVDGFLKGQLNMDIESRFGRGDQEKLARGEVPYVLDSAHYKGKYYLYYGVVPAALVMLPYSALTGHDLGVEVVVLFFVALGFIASLRWIQDFRRQYASSWGASEAFLAASFLALVPGLTFLVRRSSFYDLPVAAGFAFVVLSLSASWRALHHDRFRDWCAAGLWFGLSVGCRPNLILLGAGLLAMSLLAPIVRRSRLNRSILWMGSALLIGIALGVYNFLRFGAPWDFGFNYGMNSFFSTGNSLYAWSFVWPNFSWYFLTPPTFATWFPFVYPIEGLSIPVGYSNAEAMHGYLYVTVLVGLLLVAGIPRVLARREHLPRLLVWFLPVALVFALQLGAMLGLGIRAYRYATDFLTPASFLVLGLCWYVFGWRGRTATLQRFVLGVVTSVSVIVVLLGSIQQFHTFRYTRVEEYQWLSSTLHPTSKTLSYFHHVPPGPIQLEVNFSKPETAVVVPLVRTGIPGEYDEANVSVHPGGHVSFQIRHGPYGGPQSKLIPIEWGKDYRILVEMGSLFPNANDPFFSDWDAAKVGLAKKQARISLDGSVVINRQMAYFETPPWVRKLDLSHSNFDATQTVRVKTWNYLGPEAVKSQAPPPSQALFSLKLGTDASRFASSAPVYCSGISNEGVLLFIESLGNRKFRFMLDVWGAGLLYGEPFLAPDKEIMNTTLLVGMAIPSDPTFDELPQAKANPDLQRKLIVWVEGQIVAAFEVGLHLESHRSVSLGANDIGFSSAGSAYPDTFGEMSVESGDRARRLEQAVDYLKSGGLIHRYP